MLLIIGFSRKVINDFLLAPLVSLSENTYPKSRELQKLFNTLKNDQDCKIFLHFYVTNNKKSTDAIASIKNFNIDPAIKIKALVRADLKYLDDIHKLLIASPDFQETFLF